MNPPTHTTELSAVEQAISQLVEEIRVRQDALRALHLVLGKIKINSPTKERNHDRKANRLKTRKSPPIG